MTISGRLGRKIRLVSVLAVVAGALLAPLAGAAPAYAQTETNCGLISTAATFGQPTQLILQVIVSAPGTPTGTVTFSEGTTQLGTVTLSGIIASLTVTFPAAGSYPITATYSGDATFSGCTGTATATVNPASTSTTVTSSPNPSATGQQVTFTATVGTPVLEVPASGTVTFFDGTTQLAAVKELDGTASFATSLLAAGSHQITAVYDGNSNYLTSTSVPLTQTVVTPDTDLAISTPGNMTVDATGPSGAPVSYTLPTVTDPDDATVPAAVCSPVPGTTFAIGSTTVTCTATDPDDTPSMVSSSFTITVRGAADQLASLGQAVQGVGPGTSLADKITAAQSYLASGDTADACSTLTLFINQVKAQSGKMIPAGQAAQLITAATRIPAVLGC